MKTLLNASIFAACAALALAACCDANRGAFEPLFTGDLSDAVCDKTVWSVDKDGVLTANKDSVIFTKKDYENFELELEFRIVAGSNSGIILYATDTADWIPNSIEVQIADSSDPRFSKPTLNCGSIFGLVDSEFDTRLPFGQWQKMRVRAQGQKIDAWLNGRHVSKIDMSEWKDKLVGPNGVKILPWLAKQKKCDMKTCGRIGLQGKHGAAQTDFRNVRVRPLK